MFHLDDIDFNDINHLKIDTYLSEKKKKIIFILLNNNIKILLEKYNNLINKHKILNIKKRYLYIYKTFKIDFFERINKLFLKNSNLSNILRNKNYYELKKIIETENISDKNIINILNIFKKYFLFKINVYNYNLFKEIMFFFKKIINSNFVLNNSDLRYTVNIKHKTILYNENKNKYLNLNVEFFIENFIYTLIIKYNILILNIELFKEICYDYIDVFYLFISGYLNKNEKNLKLYCFNCNYYTINKYENIQICTINFKIICINCLMKDKNKILKLF